MPVPGVSWLREEIVTGVPCPGRRCTRDCRRGFTPPESQARGAAVPSAQHGSAPSLRVPPQHQGDDCPRDGLCQGGLVQGEGYPRLRLRTVKCLLFLSRRAPFVAGLMAEADDARTARNWKAFRELSRSDEVPTRLGLELGLHGGVKMVTGGCILARWERSRRAVNSYLLYFVVSFYFSSLSDEYFVMVPSCGCCTVPPLQILKLA